MKFVANRLSEGNNIFPAEIHIEENGVRVRIPGFLGGDTKFIDYEHISSVDIKTPLVGFSSITLYCYGNWSSAHGFKKEEVKQIKEAIDRGKAKAKIKVVNNYNYANTHEPQRQQPIVERVIEQQPVVVEQSINEVHPVYQEDTNMYSNQIEKLIAFALADGELSEKEKQILFKKAEAEGIDLDEFEMVLEAKMHQRQPLKNEKQTIEAAPKSDKFGDVKKCPSCGTIIESFSTKCSDCNFEFRNIEASKSATKFFEKLEELEKSNNNSNFITDKSSKLTLGKILLWVFFYWILIPIKVISFFINKSKPANWSSFDSRKEELIMNFPIPNTKEDIVEFMTLSVSRVKSIDILNRFGETGKYTAIWNSIWINKSQQVFSKAKLSMQNDKTTLTNIENLINSAIQSNKKEEKLAKITLLITLGLALLSIIILIKI